jgi:hypothetical protein
MSNSDSTRRSLRTGIDGILGVLAALGAVLLVPGIEDVFVEIGLGGKLSLFGVIVLAFTVFFTKLKNALEDADKIPALLKAPASDGAIPVPDPEADESADEFAEEVPALDGDEIENFEAE